MLAKRDIARAAVVEEKKKRGALEPFRETFSRAAGASVSVIVKL